MPVRKTLFGAFACAAVIVPIALGALSGGAEAQGDGDVMPIERIAPDYPPEALAAGLEGRVTLHFTITGEGTTKDIAVIESTAPEFEAPAIAALRRWRYLPRMENGQPVEKRGVETYIRFELGDD